jgi:hypothetical protein
MDLRVSARGRFEISNGGFSVVTDRSELLSQYLRAALTDQLRSDTFPSIRAADVSVASKLGEFKLESQRRIVDLISRSSFAYDFDLNNIQVDIERTNTDSILVRIVCNNGSDNNVLVSYSINGGRLELDEELDSPYLLSGSVKLIEEELITNTFTQEIDVSCEPAGLLYVCDKGVQPVTEEITVEFKNIPNLDRIIAKNVEIDGIIYPTIGAKDSIILSLSTNGESGGVSSNAFDSILISSVMKNRGTNFKITNVTAVSGDIRLIKYISSIEDWVIEVSTEGQDRVIVSVESIEALEKTGRFIYQDAKAVTQVDNYSFPNEAVRGRKFYILNTILSPGVYVVYYKGIVKNRYNGSLEEG